MSKGIRLKALDHDDLTAISACLQDAVIKVSDIAFIANSYRFAFVGNRFCWEDDSLTAVGKRARVACRFENVLKTSSQNVPINLSNHILNLLSITSEETADGTILIFLLFSGMVNIKLEVECIEAFLEDISVPWPTKNIPSHNGEPEEVSDESFDA